MDLVRVSEEFELIKIKRVRVSGGYTIRHMTSLCAVTLSSAEAIGIGLHEVSIGIGLHEVSWGEGGARGATGRRKKEEKASAGYCPVLRSF